MLPNNLDTSVSLSVGMCRTTIGAKSSTVTAARALSPDATVLSTKKKQQKTEKRMHLLSIHVYMYRPTAYRFVLYDPTKGQGLLCHHVSVAY